MRPCEASSLAPFLLHRKARGWGIRIERWLAAEANPSASSSFSSSKLLCAIFTFPTRALSDSRRMYALLRGLPPEDAKPRPDAAEERRLELGRRPC